MNMYFHVLIQDLHFIYMSLSTASLQNYILFKGGYGFMLD